MTDYRMYILVNEDIKISKGKIAGQVGHAVASYIYTYMNLEVGVKPLEDLMRSTIKEYMGGEQKKIILKCPQEKLEELERHGGYRVIRDKGYTQLEPNTLTCINYGIFTPDTIPEWIKELKLYN